jgi:protein-tyrosine phosphatase
MIDLHCHILPGLDDGASSWETTSEMYRIAANDGIRHVVATPHANDQYSYDRAQCELLLEKLKSLGHSIDFSLGCDFHCSFENVEDALLHPYRYTIGTSSYLLVEFSNFSALAVMGEALFRLASTGLVPILTHPERNMALLERPEKVLDLMGQGCLIQVTAGSFTGHWGRRSQMMAEWLLKKNAVHIVATDAHDPVHRPPVLSKAFGRVSQLAGHDSAEQLFIGNPGAIVSASRALLGR